MKKRLLIIIPILVVTGILSFIYLRTRQSVPAGNILVKSPVGESLVDLSKLELSSVKGQITNKKGETKDIDSEGIALAEIPKLTGVSEYSAMTVYADDEYNAEISKEDVDTPGSAWLIKDDGSVRLVVFADAVSNRDVKNVVRIEIR